MPIVPNLDQFNAFANSDHEGETVMLNLLRFKKSADDGEGGSGEEAYNRYGDTAIKMVEAQGGRLLWLGKPLHVLIGDEQDDAWDAVALVSYPDRQAFLDMVSQPKYQDAHKHREGGLADTVLLAMAPSAAFRTATTES
jgi:uncharacterized protein (DUF1330 family)